MPTISKQRVEIYGDSKHLVSEYDKVKAKTRAFASDTRKQINTIGKVFAGVAVAGAGALTAIYADAAKSADGLAKLSDQLGEAPERITALQHAAELTGVSTEKMNSSLARMVKRLGEAQNGTGAAVTALENLGLKSEQFFNLSPAEQFATISERVNELGTQQERAAAAAAIFGREGLALVNTMALGADGLAAMEQEVVDLGIALDRIQLAKIEAANDEFHRAKTVTSAFGNVLASEVAPIVGALSDEFIEAAKEAGGFGNIVQSGMSKSATAIGYVGDSVRGLELVWEGLKLAVARSYEFMLGGLGTLEEGFRRFMNILPGVNVSTESVLGDISRSFGNVGDEIQASMESLAMKPLPSEHIKAWVQDVSDKAQQAAEEVAANRQGNIMGPLIGGVDQLNNDAEDDSKESERLAKELERKKSAQEAKLQSVDLFLMTEEERLAESYARRQEIVANAHEMGLIDQERHNELALELAAKHEDDLATMRAQAKAAQLSNYSDLFGSMAGIAETFKGKQSGLYKGLFAASKAFAIAESIVKIQQGIASAAALPFPANIPAMATVAAQTAGIVSTIQGAQMQSFEGGGYTGSGSRTGGLDGKGGFAAMVHPKEVVTDLTKGQPTNSISIGNLVFPGVSSASEAEDAAGRAGRRITREIERARRYA